MFPCSCLHFFRPTDDSLTLASCSRQADPCPLTPAPWPLILWRHFFFTHASRQRRMCGHLFMSSLLLFKELNSRFFMISSFSDRHTSHLSLPGVYLWHFFTIFHFMLVISLPASFFIPYVVGEFCGFSVVSVFRIWFMAIEPLLKGLWALLVYSFSSPMLTVTMALYTTALV